MPRYFFHAENGQLYPDEVGTVLADLGAARIEASKVIADFMKHHPRKVWGVDPLRLTVCDEKGLIRLIVDVSAIDAPAADAQTGAGLVPSK